ncbi:vasotab-like [Lucilia sericata]|uniref:vasotab-like n=1 Tax=Lucilia sericata TaxID=13632 RepID=UPI0018A7E846|nr:vasotab-like [Lucilia sericata]
MQLTTTVCTILLLALFSVVMADECPTICPRILSPVCGTIENFEGETVECTFPNECLLRKLTCNTNQDLIKEEGPCSEDISQCIELIQEL